MAKTLADVPLHRRAIVARVGGERSFRRRLLEMGLIPGTEVTPCNVAPLGDPIEIKLRAGRLSLRRFEAKTVEVVG